MWAQQTITSLKKKENLLITLRVWLKIADEMMTVRGLDDTAQSAALSRNFSEEVQQNRLWKQRDSSYKTHINWDMGVTLNESNKWMSSLNSS